MSSEFNRGRERGSRGRWRRRSLTGIVKPETQRVRKISGEDRWSRVRAEDKEAGVRDGVII